MRTEPKRHGSQGMSNGMRIALIVTIILTAASFGVRKWRELRATPETQSNLSDTPTVRETSSPQASATSSSSNQKIGLRPELPAAQANPMTRRNAPPATPAAPQEAQKAPDQPPPPPPPQLEPPAFRLIGRHLEGKHWTVFFAHNNHVIAAAPKTELPGGFILQSIKKNGVTVIRRSNREKIEMPLEMPK